MTEESHPKPLNQLYGFLSLQATLESVVYEVEMLANETRTYLHHFRDWCKPSKVAISMEIIIVVIRLIYQFG